MKLLLKLYWFKNDMHHKIFDLYNWRIKRRILYALKKYPPYYRTLKQILKQLKKENYFTGKGWTPLLIELTEKLIAIEKKNLHWYKRLQKKNLITVAQIKEKFAGLRYYTNGINSRYADEVYTLITEYEHKSYITCEECGLPGIFRQTGWVKTLCDTHFKEWLEERGYTEKEYSKKLAEFEKRRNKASKQARNK